MFLIDGASLCYRAFYAIRNLSTSKGQPTNAVYGVVTMLKKLLESEKPDYVAVVFDMGEPTFRHKRYEAYKQHRAPMPDPLVSQLGLIKEVFSGFRIPFFEQAGFEADDLMGTIAARAVTEGLTVYLVTGDKDFLQLVGPKIKVYKPTRDGYEILDEQSLYEKWKLRPDQVVDVMALMGDDVDAIPGVPGIGEKTAVELIQKFGNVKELLAHLERVPGAARQSALRSAREQVQLSYELATLDTHVPLDLKIDSLKKGEPDGQALRKIYQMLEFKSLLKELQPTASRDTCQITVLASPEEWRRLLPAIRRAGKVALTVAASGPYPMEAEVLGIALSWVRGSALLCPEGFPLQELQPLLEDPNLMKICPHLKGMIILLERKALTLKGPWVDPCVSSYLLDPSRASHEVSALAFEFFGETITETDPLRASAVQSELSLRLMPRLLKEIEAKDLSTLLTEVEVPLAEVLARMERRGIALDQNQLNLLSQEMERTLGKLTQQIYAHAGKSFNINSPKQLAEILFEHLKLPIVKRTKTGASTDEEVLRRLSLHHELPALLLQYRELAKLNSTYVTALPALLHPETGKIHTSFHQTITATGRLSSSNPNLQNIPIRTEMGRQIRKAFVPSGPKRLFLAADYSQIELRILAHLSGDGQLIQAFQRGEDIHRITAAEIFHVDPQEVTADQRAVAKTINFGIVYGMTPFGLAKELGVEADDAGAFIERYFARSPQVRHYLKKSLEEAKKQGYCTTLFHRRRYIPELTSSDLVVRQFAERIAINAPIQGSAADLIKVAMVALDRALQEQGLDAWMVLQIHDELILDVAEEELDPVRALVQRIMEGPVCAGKTVRLSVPIEVKFKVGHHWLEASS